MKKTGYDTSNYNVDGKFEDTCGYLLGCEVRTYFSLITTFLFVPFRNCGFGKRQLILRKF